MSQGSLQDLKNGKYKLCVELPTIPGPDGKRKRVRKFRTVKASGIREARRLLAEFVHEMTSDDYFEPQNIYFTDYVMNRWLPNYAEKKLSPNTLETYMIHINKRILPAFQHFKLEQIQTYHLVQFMSNLEESGMRLDGKEGKLSGNTLDYIHRVLCNLFNVAVEWKLLKESPMKGVQKPKVKSKEVQVYTEEQAKTLLQKLTDEPLHWQIIIQLALTGGMRREEILGLEKKHFDYEKRMILIRQSLIYTKKTGVTISDLKNESSRRNIHISENLADLIHRLIEYKEEERKLSEQLWSEEHFMLFSNKDGKPFNPYSVKTWWQRFCKRHDIPYIKFHALRHTSATVLINQGVHAKIISARLGHADVKTTLNIYGHALEHADKTAADIFSSVFDEKEQK